MDDWNSQGCPKCRLAVLSADDGNTLRLLAENIEAHARLYRCKHCQAFWIETEREMHEIQRSEVLETFGKRTLSEAVRVRFRFTIRDLLWLTLVLGLCLGWWLYHLRTYQRYYATFPMRGEMVIVDREQRWQRRLFLLTSGEDTEHNPPGELIDAAPKPSRKSP